MSLERTFGIPKSQLQGKMELMYWEAVTHDHKTTALYVRSGQDL